MPESPVFTSPSGIISQTTQSLNCKDNAAQATVVIALFNCKTSALD
ncbi:hypothetical protein [Agarivorans sp. B2Z047]|nr:hypothetical protein [Agarivorans sp. B2Z047]UQN44144.1 hypothetical protein LQZ07_06625 [Agarivorans sp. B2Z047]